MTSGIKEVKQVMADAARLRRADGRKTLLFIDEIHRFNRAQQDAFLPYVESGDIVLMGATTENPSFELNAALLSRCRVLALAPLSIECLLDIQRRALADSERGLGNREAAFADEALESLQPDLRAAQVAARERSRRGGLLAGAHACCRGGWGRGLRGRAQPAT